VDGGLLTEHQSWRVTGNWKQAGKWFFPPGTRGPHFHFGSGLGLQAHHLPWQLGNWARNLASLAQRGKAGKDLANIGLAAYGAAVGANSALGANPCGCRN